MDTMLAALGLVIVVAGVYVLSRRTGVLAPVLLVLVGVALAFALSLWRRWHPATPTYELEPEIVLLFILPPLLYAAAIDTSLPAFKQNLRPIGLLSVGLVLFTTVVVGLVAHAVVPGLPLAAAFALGAVVAPPDAVAATAIARRTGLPRRVVTVLEGESLVNDATALTTLRVTTGAATGHAFSLLPAVGEFLLSSVGGLVVGAAVALVGQEVRKRTDDVLIDTTVSLLTPFVAYAPAEELRLSGVIAVVVAGLYLGHRAPVLQSARSRLQQQALWRTIEFLLQGVVFLLVGLQLPTLIEHLDVPPGKVVLTSLAVVLAVFLSRPVWVFPATYLARLVPRVRARDPLPPWQAPAVISWAGMRGVVSLAAALTLGPEVPGRTLIVFVTFVVIVATLLLQGASLPWLVRRLRLPPPDPRQDALAEATVQQAAARAAQARLEELVGAAPPPDGVADRLRDYAERRSQAAWEQLGTGAGGSRVNGRAAETPSAAYRRLRAAMLQAERQVFVQARDEGQINEEVLRRVQRDLDLEETMLTRD